MLNIQVPLLLRMCVTRSSEVPTAGNVNDHQMIIICSCEVHGYESFELMINQLIIWLVLHPGRS